jgi:hypothetical protein
MFPESHDDPSAVAQQFINAPVSVAISLDFCHPPLSVVLGFRPMVPAAMPKASVKEYRDAQSRPDNVTTERVAG